MWTATVRSKDLLEDTLKVVLDFENAGTVFSKEFTTTAPGNTWVEDQANAVISRLQSLSDYSDTVEVGSKVGG